MDSQAESDVNTDSGGEVHIRTNRFRYQVTVEPILFLVFFSTAFTESVTINVLECRVCSAGLGLDAGNCTAPLSPGVQALVQPLVARLLLAKSLLEAFFPALLSFFVGPWSDSNGRKPFLVSSIAGYAVYHVMWAALSFWDGLPPLFFLSATLALALPGGFVAIFTCAFCYIGDVTTEENRGLRMVVVESVLMLGIVVGFVVVPGVHRAVGERYSGPTIFLVAAAACLLALLYLLFRLPESVDTTQEGRKKDFFDLNHVKGMLKTITASRPRHGRAIIILLIVVCSASIATMLGEVSVRYLSLQKKFLWDLVEYNNFSALASFITAVATLVGMWLLSGVLGLTDMGVALLSLSVGLASQLLVVFSPSTLWFLLAFNLGSLGALIGPVVRSELSKMVPKSDLGKAFAFATSMEAVLPLVGGPIYTLVYSRVLSTSPMSVYYLSVGSSCLRILAVLIIILLERNYGKPYYTLLEADENSSATDSPRLTHSTPPPSLYKETLRPDASAGKPLL